MLKLTDIGHFTWGFGSDFFIEVDGLGNFVWSDPDYQGNHIILPFAGSYKEWCEKLKIPFGRDKGEHVIKDYCGNDVSIF